MVPDYEERLNRAVRYFAESPDVGTSEVAERFGVYRYDLLRSLSEHGIHPMTGVSPEELLDNLARLEKLFSD